MSKNWELDDVKRLIVEYKKRPVLWQLNHPAYGKKGPRAKAMKELTEIFVGRSKFSSCWCRRRTTTAAAVANN